MMSSSNTKPDNSKWIHAHYDPLAALYTFTHCISFSDLNADGDHKLLIADLGTGTTGMKLKVFKGTSLMSENTLLDLPTAVTTFYLDLVQPRTPAVAVASGPYIYIYKNLRPYFKFTLPALDIIPKEEDLWDAVKNGNITTQQLREQLDALQADGSEITVRSLRLLQLPSAEADAFVELYKPLPLKRQTVITCMDTLKKTHSEDDAIGCLVLGTEHCQIYFLDPEAFIILATVNLDSVPVFINVTGLYDVEFRVVCACRNGSVYNIKRGDTAGRLCFQLAYQPVGLVRESKHIIVGCMDSTLQCFSFKGKKMWQVNLPANITAMDLLDNKSKNFKATLVALDNHTVQVYRDKYLVDTIHCEDTVTAIKYGHFGREDNTLVMVTRGGGLIVMMLKRTADLDIASGQSIGPPMAQTKKLDIPKKTKLYVDQTLRERDNATAMHRQFQHDLYRMRLRAARAYVKALENSENPISSNPQEPIKLNAQVQGIGPTFKLIIQLQNTSMSLPSLDLLITFLFDTSLYELEKEMFEVPMLVPGLNYSYKLFVDCKTDKNISDSIKVLVLKKGKAVPVITAVINMPISETMVVV